MKTKSNNTPLQQCKYRSGVLCLLILLSLLTCKTAKTGNTDDLFPSGNKTRVNRQDANVQFINNTPLVVRIVRGTGTVDEGIVYPGDALPISFIQDSGTVFYTRFYLPLTKDFLYPPLNERGLDSIERIFFRVDGSLKEQRIVIPNPAGIIDNSTFIVLTNNSSRGGLNLENPAGILHCLFPSRDKRIINVQETVIYTINPLESNNLFITPVNIQLEKIQYLPGYIYSFTFNDSNDVYKVTLTDARPLHRVGESARVIPIPDAAGLMPFAAAGNEICLFVFTDKNITRHVYDSAGNIKTSVQSKDGFTITYAAAVKDGFFAAGYERNGRNYKPRARVLAADGVLRRELPESNDYESASFYTAAQKDANTWLFAGNGVKNGYFGAAAYARLVRDEGSNLTAVKEWGGIDFPECRDIKSAVYSHIHDCWFVTGEKTEPFNGSYLARINNDGTIQIIDSFEEKYFLKILIDDNGGIYLAGEEQKSNETFAALVKYNADGKKIWQFLNQPPSHSCYYTAVFDDKESRIVLAGTLQAKDQYAAGGKPFIEAVGMADGSPVWREIFSDPEFDKTALASAVIPAPDYGYVLALSGGVGNDYKDKPPFKIARINSQGKLKKY